MSKAEDLAGLLDANGDVLSANLDNVSVAFSEITSKPTTLAGYGITDAATSAQGTNADTAYGWGDHGAQGYATTTYVDTSVSNLVAAAPTTLDTLNELAAALGDDANFSTTVTNSLALKANSADLATVATTGAYSDLTGTPTAVSSFTNDSGYAVENGAATFTTLNATTVDLGNWTVTESAGVLYFATGGVNKMKLDASGNLTVTGDVTAFGTV